MYQAESQTGRVMIVGHGVAATQLKKRVSGGDPKWSIAWATGPRDAQEALKDGTFDIVVGDAELTETEAGLAFFRVLRTLAPSCARVALAGTGVDQAATDFRSLTFCALPAVASLAELESNLDRIHTLHQYLKREGISKMIRSIERLPSVPQAYRELSSAACRPQTTIADIARIVQTDPTLAAKVLALANSAQAGRRSATQSIACAVGWLGLETIKGLALTTNMFSALDERAMAGFSIQRFQGHAIAVGRLAQEFLPPGSEGDAAFTAGLVHDLGKLVLALCEPLQFAKSVKIGLETGVDSESIEQELMGVTHAEAGAYVLSLWALPLPILECAAFHATPSKVEGGDRRLLAAVHAATVLLNERENPGVLDVAFIANAGLAGELPRWQSLAKERLQQLKSGSK